MHDYIIPIGPQIQSIKEPTCLRIKLKGNYIQDARIRLGYAHRAIEKILEGKTVEQGLVIAERICGICESAHSQAYIRAIENILKYNPPKKVRYLRTLIAELERIHSHLLWAGFMAHEIGYDILFMFFWRERERILEIFEKITGGRVHHAANKIMTVRYDLEQGDIKFILDRIKIIEKRISDYLPAYRKNNIIRARLVNVGTIARQDAKRFCLVGPVARASGISDDIRKADPYAAYKDVDFNVIIEDRGDALSRTSVRLREVLESANIIRQLLASMPEEKIPAYKKFSIKSAEACGRVEAPRGENFHFIKIRNNVIGRARIRTPTYNNLTVLEQLLVGMEIGDTPVVLDSLDPCFGCMERVMMVKNNRTQILSEKQFRRKCRV